MAFSGKQLLDRELENSAATDEIGVLKRIKLNE